MVIDVIWADEEGLMLRIAEAPYQGGRVLQIVDVVADKVVSQVTLTSWRSIRLSNSLKEPLT